MGRISFLLIFFPFPLPFPFPWDLLFFFFFSPRSYDFPFVFFHFFLPSRFWSLFMGYVRLSAFNSTHGFDWAVGGSWIRQTEKSLLLLFAFSGVLVVFSLFFMLFLLQARHYSYGCLLSHSLQFCKKRVSLSLLLFFFFSVFFVFPIICSPVLWR